MARKGTEMGRKTNGSGKKARQGSYGLDAREIVEGYKMFECGMTGVEEK